MMQSRPPPPAPSSWRWHLDRTARIASLLALLLVTGVSVRFGIAGLTHALDYSRSNFADRPRSHGGAASARPIASAPGRVAQVATEGAVQVAHGEQPPGKPLRITLGVTAGPPRSEVYVAGRRVGQTPFLGDTSCKAGQPLRIEIVPEKGAPLTYERLCKGRLLEISSLPP